MKKCNLVINSKNKKSKINKEIYGHFSEHLGRCIYEGIYVGEDSDIPNTKGMRDDVVAALKELEIPVLRWPGGCFADEYHWKDGIGPKEGRKKMVNTHWGGVVEDNSFGTHEFFELCDQLDCEPYVAGNLGSGTVQELAEWVEYMTFDGESPMSKLREANGRKEPWKLKYLGIGNENWGCGGNMEPEHYGDLYRRYQTYCRNFSGNELYKIACGPNVNDYHWTDKLMEKVKPCHTKAISLHYYTVPGSWDKKGSATEFDEKKYYQTIAKTLYMEELIQRHLEIMSKHDPKHEISLIVDEWGTWYDVEEGTNPGFLYQQNTMRDAMVVAINLNIFNNHSDRIVMANIAQTVNVLQAVILTEGAKIVKTPTYHVFRMYKKHQEAALVDSYIDLVKISEEGEELQPITVSSSVNSNGELIVTLSNCSLSEKFELETTLTENYSSCIGEVLTAKMDDYNRFDSPEEVIPQPFDGFELSESGVKIVLPECSVVTLVFKE